MADGNAIGQTPPHDLEAERAVIGGVLVIPESLGTIEPVVGAADFYHPAHRSILEAFFAVRARGAAIDIVTVADELRAGDRLNAVGGVQFLGMLSDCVATIAHIEHHARIVADLAQLRRLIAAASKVISGAYETRGDVKAFVSETERSILKVCERRAIGSVRHISVGVEKSFGRIERAMQSSGGARVTGMATGLHDLDRKIFGLHDGQVIVIAACTAMGKSSLMMNIVEHIAMQGAPCLVESGEMTETQYSDRTLAGIARVDQDRVRGAMLTQDDMSSLAQAGNVVFQLPIWINDSSHMTLGTIAADARRAKREKGIRLLAVDHLGMMDLEQRPGERHDLAVGRFTHGMKSLAKELGIPVLLLCQLNRDCAKRPDKRPMLSDLRNSGDIEQDADVVMFIYRDEVFDRNSVDKGVGEIIVAKQREGSTGIVRVRWIGALTRFENLAEEDPQHEAPASSERARGKRTAYAKATAPAGYDLDAAARWSRGE